ncbi:MAG: Trm112 family protein [Chloroflexota bacterium]|nr:MAG: Trm112 family protein [Chloroflexota bacterium]
MPISKDLLDILACPACKTPIEAENEELVCKQCERRYPIRNDIPYMLISDGDEGLAAFRSRPTSS